MADGFQTSPNPTVPPMVRRSFSVAELDAMFDAEILSRDEKIELIDGDIFKMNSQMMPHALLKSRLARKLMALIPETFDVIVEGSMASSNQSLLEPDIMITARLPIERRYLRPEEVMMAIEVADTSLSFDLGTKPLIYGRAGISEFWVIDINSAKTWVHRLPSEGGYQSIVCVAFDAPIVPLVYPTITITVSAV